MTTFTGTAAKDTWISDEDTTTNYGTAVNIFIGNGNTSAVDGRGLLQFDLTSIPITAVVSAATLSVYFQLDRSSGLGTMSAYRVIRPWVETQATWAKADSSTGWTGNGCSDTTDDREAAALGVATTTGTETLNTEKQMTLDNAKVQEWIAGGFANNGLLLQMTPGAEDNAWGFHSIDGATSSYDPKIIIVYAEADSGYNIIVNT